MQYDLFVSVFYDTAGIPKQHTCATLSNVFDMVFDCTRYTKGLSTIFTFFLFWIISLFYSSIGFSVTDEVKSGADNAIPQ